MKKTLKSFLTLSALIALLLVPATLKAESEAYAEYSADAQTLTFRYDDQKASSTATATYSIATSGSSTYNTPKWCTYGSNITKVVFDSSFADFRPTSCYYWFYTFVNLTSIEGIENLNTSEVTDMSGMFWYCSSLTSLDLSHFDTSKVTSMSCMFNECSGLTTLDLSTFDTSSVDYFSGMFSKCSGLTSINLSSFNTAKAESLSSMFYKCKSLTVLNLNTFDTSTVEETEGMFENCESLKAILVGDSFVLSDDCSGGTMFTGCTSLPYYDSNKVGTSMANTTTGYLTKYEANPEAWAKYDEATKTLTFLYNGSRESSDATATFEIDSEGNRPWTQDYAGSIEKVVFDKSFTIFQPTSCSMWFFAMTELTDIEGIRYFDTSAVTNMQGLFSYCSSLTSIDLGGFNTSAVTDMRSMFAGASKLTELDLSAFKTSKVTDMNTMFYNCESLATIRVSGTFIVSDECTGNNMFYGCTSLNGFDSTKIGKEMANTTDGYFTDTPVAWVEYQDATKTLTFRYDGQKDVTEATATYLISANDYEIGWSLDYGSAIEKVVIDSKFANARPTSCYYWFTNLTKIKEIEGLENLNTSEVTNMGGMFNDCESLETLDLSHFDTSNVTKMSSMFSRLKSLKTLDLSSFNTSKVNDMNSMFMNSTGLTSINFSSFDTSEVTTMMMMFMGCTGLTELDLSSFKTPKLTNLYDFVCKCSGLTKINLSNFDTKNVTSVTCAFQGCSSLEELDLSSFDTSSLTSMTSMFRDCTSLKKINLSSFNTSAVTDMSCLFWGCSSLPTVDLSNFDTSSVTTFGSMFDDCTSLSSIDLTGFNTASLKVASEMFANCTSLKEIDLTSFDTTQASSLDYMFKNSTALEHIYVSDKFKLSSNGVGYSMFYGCKLLPNYSQYSYGGSECNYTTGYLTLRRHFSVGDERFNADGVDAVCNDNVVFSDDKDYVSDCDFTFASSNTATFEHNDAEGWSTLCLPFAFNVEDNTVADFYAVTAVSENSVTTELLSGTVAAGTPILAFSRNKSYTIKGATEANAVKDPIESTLKGTFTATTVDTSANNYVLSGNKFWNVNSLPTRAASAALSACSAYLTTDATTAAYLTISAEETSGINSIDVDNLLEFLNGAEIYNLNGQRLPEPPVKGVVIVKKGNETRKLIFN